MNRLIAALLATAVLSLPAGAAAQDSGVIPPTPPSLRTFFPDLAKDVRQLPSDPGAVSIAIGAILSTSLYPLDDNVNEWTPANGYKPGKYMGNFAVLAAGTLATYGIGAWAGTPGVTALAADLLRSQALALGLTYGLKYAVQRPRPDGTSDDSFPSGHASETFAVASVLTKYYGWKGALPGYSWASYVAVSRLNQKRHFLSDVVFGAGLGLGVGWSGARPESNWRIVPEVSPSRASINVTRSSRMP